MTDASDHLHAIRFASPSLQLFAPLEQGFFPARTHEHVELEDSPQSVDRVQQPISDVTDEVETQNCSAVQVAHGSAPELPLDVPLPLEPLEPPDPHCEVPSQVVAPSTHFLKSSDALPHPSSQPGGVLPHFSVMLAQTSLHDGAAEELPFEELTLSRCGLLLASDSLVVHPTATKRIESVAAMRGGFMDSTGTSGGRTLWHVLERSASSCAPTAFARPPERASARRALEQEAAISVGLALGRRDRACLRRTRGVRSDRW